MGLNEKYSYKDFTDKDLSATDPAEWSDTTVQGSVFYQQNKPGRNKVFPDGVRNCILRYCNTDNCVIPDGFILGEGSTNRRIQVQNDGCDWELDEQQKPTKSLHPNPTITDPKDIPKKCIREEVITKAEHDAGQKSKWFKDTPEIVPEKTVVARVGIELRKSEWDRATPEVKSNTLEVVKKRLGLDELPQATVHGDKVKIEADRTEYTVRGECWLYWGQWNEGKE